MPLSSHSSQTKYILMWAYVFLSRTVMDLLCSGSVVYSNSKGIKGNQVKLNSWGGEGGRENKLEQVFPCTSDSEEHSK